MATKQNITLVNNVFSRNIRKHILSLEGNTVAEKFMSYYNNIISIRKEEVQRTGIVPDCLYYPRRVCVDLQGMLVYAKDDHPHYPTEIWVLEDNSHIRISKDSTTIHYGGTDVYN